jgi:hypothetical protein
VQSIPQFGCNYSIVKFAELATSNVQKFKGEVDDGDLNSPAITPGRVQRLKRRHEFEPDHLPVQGARDKTPAQQVGQRPDAMIDHIGYTVADFNRERAKAELIAMGVKCATAALQPPCGGSVQLRCADQPRKQRAHGRVERGNRNGLASLGRCVSCEGRRTRCPATKAAICRGCQP